MGEPKDFLVKTSDACGKVQMNSGNSSVIFPFHVCNIPVRKQLWLQKDAISSWLLNRFKVHAAEIAIAKDASGSKSLQTNLHPEKKSDSEKSISIPAFSSELEMLAQAYIQEETGMERVRMIFKKDHMGNYSHELEYIQVVLMQTFVISFFMKYVPEFRFAKQDFIREHHGTVFRTRLEAVRRMQDHISLRATTAGGKFAVKMTAFATGFSFLSQMIASYRNKTSVLEYAAAAGLTGGLARIQLGIKGFIAGSFLGSVLGSLVGCVAYTIFRAYDATQEQRHFQNVMLLLQVQKSVEGEKGFKERLEKVKQAQLSQSLPDS